MLVYMYNIVYLVLLEIWREKLNFSQLFSSEMLLEKFFIFLNQDHCNGKSLSENTLCFLLGPCCCFSSSNDHHNGVFNHNLGLSSIAIMITLWLSCFNLDDELPFYILTFYPTSTFLIASCETKSGKVQCFSLHMHNFIE